MSRQVRKGQPTPPFLVALRGEVIELLAPEISEKFTCMIQDLPTKNLPMFEKKSSSKPTHVSFEHGRLRGVGRPQKARNGPSGPALPCACTHEML